MRWARRFLALVAISVYFSPLYAAEPAEAPAEINRADFQKNGLFRYVVQPDESYAWTKRREGKIGKGTYVELTLISQTWRGIVWKHQLFVIKPSTMKPGTQRAVLVIEGGRWHERLGQPTQDQRLPGEAPLFAELAEKLQAPLAVLLQVPQQPIFDGMIEDQAISYTFEQFLKTKDDTWPLLLPMTKSAVRAMDAVTEFAADEWSLELKEFTVTGASKRGWTTWLVGAVDPRVTNIAPMVIDMLNMDKQLPHQLATWGAYSNQIHDYTDRGIHKHISTPGGQALRAMVDPYSFRELLTQPKLIILGTNDRYWTLDALDLYWDDLRGDKYVLYVPNNRHGLKDYPRVLGSIVALHQLGQTGQRLPQLDWKFQQDQGKLRLSLQSDKAAEKVRVWVASSKTRDFRQAQWIAADLDPAEADESNTYALDLPAKGYLAMFGEWQFAGETMPYFLSTNVKIVPGADVAVE